LQHFSLPFNWFLQLLALAYITIFAAAKTPLQHRFLLRNRAAIITKRLLKVAVITKVKAKQQVVTIKARRIANAKPR
jgi:hypothetical protein